VNLIDALKETAHKPKLCYLGLWITEEAKTTDAELFTAAQQTSIAHLHRALKALGYPGSDAVVKKHMKKECVCCRESE
jgi:HEAT repeat protein